METIIQPINKYEDLNFSGGVAEVDYNTLKQSADITDLRGNLPKSRPLHHYELLNMLQDKWDKHVGDIADTQAYVYEKYSRKVGMKDVNISDVPIENLLFERMIGKITGPGEELGIKTELAFAIHEKGVSLGFGGHVSICKNFCIMGGQVRFTYGKDKESFEKAIQDAEEWMMNWESHYGELIRKAKIYQERQVDVREIYEFIGRISSNAVIYNKNRSVIEDVPALNVTQVNRLIEQAHGSKTHSHIIIDKEGNHSADVNLWDVANWGTWVLKPQYNDATSSLQDNAQWHNILDKSFLN